MFVVNDLLRFLTLLKLDRAAFLLPSTLKETGHEAHLNTHSEVQLLPTRWSTEANGRARSRPSAEPPHQQQDGIPFVTQ